MKNIPFILLIICLLPCLSGCENDRPDEVPLVAHAGGGVNGKRYTNSIEALNYNYEKGFRLFEIDFSWTTDNHLVCLHDWKQTAKRLFNYTGETAMSYSDFKAITAAKSAFELCDLKTLNQWLLHHHDAKIITDIKGKNFDGLQLISQVIDDASSKVIPQFTQSEHYQKISTLGFEQHIWTLYSYKGSIEKLVNEAPKMQLFAITMPPSKAKALFAQAIKQIRVPTYVHTINDLDGVRNFQKEYSVTSVYTDFLNPHTLNAKKVKNEGSTR